MADRIRVLYVDDEPGLLEAARRFLGRSGGFRVGVSTSAREALDTLPVQTFDAIIADYQMPGMDGIAFLKEIRERFGDIPFILLTEKGREKGVIEAINNGADFSVQKGGDPADQFGELAHKVREVVKRRRAEDERVLLKASIDQACDEVFGFDSEGTILYVNEAACRITGYSRDELIGMKLFSLDPDFTPGTWEQSVAGLRQRKKQLIRTRHRCKDGTVLNVEIMTTCVRKGGKEYSFAFVRDITGRRRADDAMQAEETKYRDLADFFPQIIFELDPEFRVTYANRYAKTTLGITDRDLENGINGFSFIDPSDHDRLKKNVKNRLKGILGEPQEYSALRKDGTSFPVIIYAAPVFHNKTLAGYRGVVIDISARKAIEGGLLESESKFRTVFESSPYPIAINRCPDNAFLEVNKAFLDVSGYTEAEIIGKNPVELGLLTLPETAKLITKRVLTGKIENVPLTLKAKGGREVNVLFSTMPVTIGNKPATVTVTTEVTKLKRVEEELLRKNEDLNAAYEQLAVTDEELRHNYDKLRRKEEVLRKSEEKFRALVELSLEGILITDFSGKLLFANRAAGLIVDAPDYETMIGKRNILGFVAPESQADVLRDFSNVAKGTDAYLVTYKLVTEKKREIWVECIGKKIPFLESSAMLVSMRDVTERKKAEDAIRESENRFATVFRSSPVALTLVNATDGKFVDVNDAFLTNTGYTRDEVIGRMSEELGIFSDGDDYKRFVSDLREQSMVQGRELMCRVKSGGIRTCLFSSGVIMMGGKPHILSTVEDITGRKAAESAIRAIVRSMVGTTGLNSLRKITETVSSWLGADCVMVGEIQPDRQTVKVLSMLLDGKEVSGFSYTLKGTPCENVAEKGYCLYPDDARQAFPDARDLADLNIRGYAGTPLWDSRGEVIGILCVLSRGPLSPSPATREILDIIATKAAAEVERIRIVCELQKSRQMLAEAMEMAQLVNWEYDVATGMFTFDDRFYAMYGTTAEREGGTMMSAETYAREFVHPEERGIVCEEGEKALQATDPAYLSRREHRIVRRDGEVRHIAVHIGITKDAEGRTIKTHGANQDVTERRKAEEEIRRANLQLNLLGRITRHDIINKISIILGYLRIAEMKFPDPVLVGILKKIESNTIMIRNEIEFTRIYRDLGTHDPQWLALDAVMPSIPDPAAIALVPDLRGISVFADPMLEKVFANLLDNTVRHGQRATEVRVSYRQSGDNLVVVWEDNGIGIPDSEKERIFEQGAGKNTGLGLFLAREILSLTGITIKETGEAGKGARFEITVPKEQYVVPAQYP